MSRKRKGGMLHGAVLYYAMMGEEEEAKRIMDLAIRLGHDPKVVQALYEMAREAQR